MRGRKIGLLTNQTGQARDGVSAIDLLDGAGNLELIALFSPEHGIARHAVTIACPLREIKKPDG